MLSGLDVRIFPYICEAFSPRLAEARMLELKNVCMEPVGDGPEGGVSLTAEGGQVVGFGGGSEQWQTRLLRAMLGLEPVASGYISIDGELVTPLSAPVMRRQMGYVPRAMRLPEMSVESLLSQVFAPKAGNANGTFATSPETSLPEERTRPKQLTKRWRASLASCLGALQLGEHVLTGQTTALSPSEQCRLFLALAMVSASPYVFLDHPLCSQPRELYDDVRQCVEQMRSQKRTVVVAVGQQEEAAWCDKLIK